MARDEVAVCDRCGDEARGEAEVKEFGLMRIVVGREQTYSTYTGIKVNPASMHWEGEWCRACCAEVGVDKILNPYVTPEVKDEPKKEVPSLEEMVREIVREEVDR